MTNPFLLNPRSDGRAPNQLRPVSIRTAANPYAEGSAEIRFGKTQVLCCVSIEREVPAWMQRAGSEPKTGWITAEYGMLPRATHTRNRRESSQGKQGGRTLEIQRLIGRALRRAIDLTLLPGLTVRIDCDVLVADGGTRTAAISGAWVALKQAIEWAHTNQLIAVLPPVKPIAAVSVGILEGRPLLDLAYDEDSAADFDLNVVADHEGRIIEIQGTGEKSDITRDELSRLIDLGFVGINSILEIQQAALLQGRIAEGGR